MIPEIVCSTCGGPTCEQGDEIVCMDCGETTEECTCESCPAIKLQQEED